MIVLARRQATAVFLAFAFSYFFAALLRTVAATLSPTLTREFSLQAGELGLLGGAYFLGFAAMQLPLGAWLDRHGPKKVVIGFLLIATAGCCAFALAQGFTALLAARLLCGVGASACLMAPLTGFRRWFAPQAQLRANSWMLMVGSVGMVASTLPVQWIVPLAGWRPVFWALAGAFVLGILLVAWRVPGASPDDASRPVGPAGGYGEVWRHPYFRRMAPVGFFSYGGMMAVQTLWAGPWMVRVAGYDPLRSAQGLLTINLGLLAAFCGWGLLNPLLARRGFPAERLIALVLPLSFAALGALVWQGPAAGGGTLALLCVSSTVVSLALPAVAMVFPAAQAGRALSAFNLVIFLGVFVMQWAIGLLVDAFRVGGASEVDAFRAAFAVFLGCSLLAYAYFMTASRHNPQQ
jgi:predicted MFS family arabinose efflux permease